MSQRYDLTGTAKITHWATYSYIAMQVSYSVFLLYYNKVYADYLANEAGISEIARITAMDRAQLPVGIGFIVGTILIYILNANWVFRASSNAALAVPSDERIRPNWAIIWYVIPVASLWMPYRAMKQTWAASVGGGVFESPVPGWFSFWWMAWVLLTIADGAGSNFGVSPTATPQEFMTGNLFLAITGVLWAVPAVLFLRIVREVTAHQGSAADVFA